MPSALSFKQAAEKLAASHPHLKLVTFTGTKNPIEVFCLKHKQSNTYTSYQMIKGCAECAKEKWRVAKPATSHKAYVAAVRRGSNNKFAVLDTYVNANTKLRHMCRDCNTIVSVTPKSMLQHFGCRNCGYAKGGATGSTYRTVKLGSRTVRVQGCEREALTFITMSLKANPNDIVVGSEGKIQGINYELLGKKHLYRPDFFIPKYNRLIEVKSTWFFGLTNQDFYNRLVAKAKACTEQGYDFRVVIANLRNHAPILLPKTWFTMTHVQFQKFWVKKYRISLTGCLL